MKQNKFTNENKIKFMFNNLSLKKIFLLDFCPLFLVSYLKVQVIISFC